MIVFTIICIVLAAEIFFVIRQFMALREILRRSSYACRTRGSVTERRQINGGKAPTFRYTVQFLADEQPYQIRFTRQDTDMPIHVGKRIVLHYPEGKPSAAYAALETDRFQKQYRLTLAHIFLLYLTAFGFGAVTEFLPIKMQVPVARALFILWLAASMTIALYLICMRIYWRTQSGRTEAVVLESVSTSYRGSTTHWHTVRYTVDGETFTCTCAQSGLSRSHRKDDRIPIRYLRRAPFAAECADHIELLPWFGVFMALLFPAMMLFWYLTGE
jgi:hypothetical protein